MCVNKNHWRKKEAVLCSWVFKGNKLSIMALNSFTHIVILDVTFLSWTIHSSHNIYLFVWRLMFIDL